MNNFCKCGCGQRVSKPKNKYVWGHASKWLKGCIPWNKGLIGYMAGEMNYNWKGGITPLKHLIRHHFKYRQWRSDIFTKDDFTCQICGEKGCYLEAHHCPKKFSEIINEYQIKTLEHALNCEELWNINNGITLCRKCHDKTKKGHKLFE